MLQWNLVLKALLCRKSLKLLLYLLQSADTGNSLEKR